MKRAWILAVALLALVPAAAHAKRVRVFAVGPKFDLSWVDTRDHFRGKLLALMDAGQRGGGAPAVQAGAGDVASHLLRPADPARAAQTARDLVALPEDIGLMSALTGERARPARSAPDLTSAIGSLLATYAPVSAYYAARFPSLLTREPPPTRLLGVALTDTFARVAVETFAELADRYDVYLEAGVNMVRDWQVVCVSKASMPALPGGVQCDVEDPARVAALRMPEDVARTYAYEATAPNPSNMALVFDPDGKLISKQVKTYLTPVELPGQLDLVPGEVSAGLSALRTPVGVLGFVTSKDAWMPDVTTKLDQAGVEILVQPEFFVNDTVARSGMWAPDTLKSSGYSAILRHPSMQALVLPELTGNLYDFSADAQQHIALKPRSVRLAQVGALVGQPVAPGLNVVAPWVVKDPLTPEEPFAERRERLGRAGEALLPGGPPCESPSQPGPCAGGQVEGVLFADVQVGEQRRLRRQRRRRAVPPFTANKPIAPSRRGQRNVSLAGARRRVVAAFEEQRGERHAILVARSPDDGARWSKPVRPLARRAGAADEWWPSVSVGSDGDVWLAWQDDSTGTFRVYAARSTDGGRRFGAPIAVDATAPPGVRQLKPSIAGAGRDSAVVAWVDERSRFTAEDLPQAGIWAARIEGSAAGKAQRIDSTAPPAALSTTLDHAWAPNVAARGERVAITWTDFRTYDWDVYLRESEDGGRTFGAERAVNDAPADVESLTDRPQAALLDGGPLVAFTDWRKDDASARSPHRLYDAAVGVPGSRTRAVDGHGDDHTSAFAPAIAALPGDSAVVAWQDHARGPGDIRAARVTRTSTGRPVRVDDSGDAGWNQWRPAAAVTRARVVIAWEDERDGPAQIYVARAAPGRLR